MPVPAEDGGSKEAEEQRNEQADPSEKPDLRYTRQADGNVEIERSMDGSGHLARGDRTRMSVLKFSSRHVARDERDPEFAFRPPPASARPTEDEAPATEPVAASEPPPAVSETSNGMIDRLKRLFGLTP